MLNCTFTKEKHRMMIRFKWRMNGKQSDTQRNHITMLPSVMTQYTSTHLYLFKPTKLPINKFVLKMGRD